MKALLLFLAICLFACNTQKDTLRPKNELTAAKGDTVRIANDSLEYEIIIIDPGFNSWLASRAQPRNYYTQSYLENRNYQWVLEWNNRARQPMNFRRDLYEMEIDYRSGINYGYEVNYLLFNYLTYFQITHNQRLGGFVPRI